MQRKSRDDAGRSSRRSLERELSAAGDPRRAEFLQGYFKTEAGGYGEGDRFLGIPIPLQRKIALRHRALAFDDLSRLLASSVHEHRFAALEILVAQFEAAAPPRRQEIVSFYLRHTHRMSNWDLVDTSAPYLLGEYLKDQPRGVLDILAASANVWERRIAIISTLALIRCGETEDAFRIAKKLLPDEHDLIHKAVGWALRETGKISRAALVQFIEQNYGDMPRTTLRYAIERLPAAQRKQMLAGIFSGAAEDALPRRKNPVKKARASR